MTRCNRCHFALDPNGNGACQCGGLIEAGNPDPFPPASITSGDPFWFAAHKGELTLLCGPKAARAPGFVTGRLGDRTWHIRKGEDVFVQALCGVAVSEIVESLFSGKARICGQCRKLYDGGAR